MSSEIPVLEGQEQYFVKCLLSSHASPLTILIHPEWAPIGAKRFTDMVNDGFFEEMGLFRAVRNFLVQFGISNYPEKNEQWRAFGAIPDDPSFGMRFRKGFMSFAGGGVNSRTTQVFIALADSGHLGRAAWETPFGEVLPPHDVLDSISTVHGDQKPFNPNGVDQGRLRREGNSYLASDFPDLTYLERCWVEPLKQEGSDSAAASLDVMSLR